MQEFQAEKFMRPWIEGVAVVADLVSDAAFDVTGLAPSMLDDAAAVVAAQDRAASADVRERLAKPGAAQLAAVEGADWVSGFEDALCALAAAADFGTVKTSPFSAGIIGLPITRNEWDSRADLDAVVRLVKEGVGLSVASCWPCHGTVADLGSIARAGVLLALPYGRRVAKVIAARTGARVVEVGLPFGFDGCSKFVRTIGEALGRSDRAGEFVDRELARIVPRFEWVVPHSLINRRIALVGDSAFMEAAAGFLYEVGCDVCRCASTGSGSYTADLSAIVDDDPPEALMLVVGNGASTDFCVAGDQPFMETGWPSLRFHSFYPRPYLGFDGAAAFLQDMVNRMSFFEIMTSWKNTVVNEADQ